MHTIHQVTQRQQAVIEAMTESCQLSNGKKMSLCNLVTKWHVSASIIAEITAALLPLAFATCCHYRSDASAQGSCCSLSDSRCCHSSEAKPKKEKLFYASW